MLKLRKGRCATRDESGVSIVLVALLVTVLMVFAAIAIDEGGAYNLRRQYQAQADAGALAGAALLPNESDSGGATDQIITFVNKNLGTAFGNSDFNTCTDTPPTVSSLKAAPTWIKYTDPVSKATYSCIAYDSAAHLAWVEVPRTQPYRTTFGRFAGRTSITIGAFAIAALGGVGAGGVLPLAMASGTGAGLQCVKTGSGSKAGACTGATTGNFGPLEFGEYGNPLLGTTCNKPAPGLFGVNLAEGLDHDLAVYSGTPLVDSAFGCSGSPGPLDPNTTNTETGDITNAFDNGILSSTFSDGQGGRLTRSGKESEATSFNVTTTIAGTGGIDDTGLWQFIPPGTVPNVPDSCQRSVFTTAYDKIPTSGRKANMIAALNQCFSDYGLGLKGLPPAAGTLECLSVTGPKCGPLFSLSTSHQSGVYDIQLSPRFNYVPVLTGGFPTGTSLPVQFSAFAPLYLQSLSGNGFNFDPGVGDGGQGGNKADSVSAYAFYPQMLPGSLGTNPFKLGESEKVTLLR